MTVVSLRFVLVLLFAFALVSNTALVAQTWEIANANLFPPSDQTPVIDALSSNGASLWAAKRDFVGSGFVYPIYRSANNGASWSLISSTLFTSNGFEFEFNATSIFAVEWLGVWRSTDNGTSWTSMQVLGSPSARSAAPPVVARTSGTTSYGSALAVNGASLYYASVSQGGVFRSLNNGTTWERIEMGLPRNGFGNVASEQFTDIEVVGTTLLLGTRTGLFRSTNNGALWSSVSLGASSDEILSLCALDANTVLAYVYSGKIWRSTTAGASWQVVGQFPSSNNGTITSAGNGRVFVGTAGSGIKYSTDNGASWLNLNGGWINLSSVWGFCAAPTTLFAATPATRDANGNFITGLYRMDGYTTLPGTTPPSSIRGTITNGANAIVNLTGAANRTTTASATGAYSFGSLANGNYTITPTLAGMTFFPASTTVTVNGANINNLNFQAFATPPSSPATAFMVSALQSTSLTLSWTAPSGGASSYIVVARAAGGAPSFVPQNGTTPSGVNSNFSLASPQGTGDKVVFDGTGTSVSITGLTPQTAYTFLVYPSNGTGAVRSYTTLSPLSGSTTTPATPTLTLSPLALDFSSVIVGASSTASVSVAGTALVAGVSLTASHPAYTLSLTNSPFTAQASITLSPSAGTLAPTQIFVRFTPTMLGTVPATVSAVSSGAITSTATLTGIGLPPPTYSVFGNAGLANAVLNLTGGATMNTAASVTGAYSFHNLANGNYTITPSFVGTSFTPASTTVTVSGTNINNLNFQALATPPNAPASSFVVSLLQATSATLSWTAPAGGAQSYVVVIRANGTPGYVPVNGTSATTGVASDFTLAASVHADGSRIVYDGTGTSFTLTGLNPLTSYTVVVYPSNGTGALRSYRTLAPLTSSVMTLPTPNVSLTPSPLDFGSVTIGTVSTASFSVSGVGLTNVLTLTSSNAIFSLSSSNSPFTTQASLTLTPVNATLAPTTVFVRFSPSTTGANVGAVIVSGASSATLSLTGNGLPIPPPPVLRATYSGVRTPIDPTDTQTFTVSFRNAANALVDYAGSVDFRGGTPVGSSTGTLALTRLSLGTYQASGRFAGLGAYTLSLQTVTSSTSTRTFTVQAAVNNPVPVLSSISPATTTATTNTWTLTLNGSNFLPETQVVINGVTLATQSVQFISGAQLKAELVQPLAGLTNVWVFNPAPVGGTSATRTLTVNNPVPNLASISPTSIRAGEETVLTLTGGYFTSETVVRVTRGATTSTLSLLSLSSSTLATVQLPADLCTTAATYQISVRTPVFGGGTSGAKNLVVLGNTAVASEFVNVTTAVIAGSSMASFTVRLRDVFGNLTDTPTISSLNFTESTGTSSGTILLSRTGVGTMNFVRRAFHESGLYTLWIQGISSTTGSRSFTVAGGGDSRVTISGVPATKTAGTTLASFTLRFEDAFGNLTDNSIGRLTYTRPGTPVSTATLAMTRVSEGLYTAQSTVCTLSGVYTLAVSSVGAANTLGTKNYTVLPEIASQVEFTITTSAMTRAGARVTYNIEYRDPFNNLADMLGEVEIDNTELASTATYTARRLSQGVYTTQATVTQPGVYRVRPSKLGARTMQSGGDTEFTVSPGRAVRGVFANIPPNMLYLEPLTNATVTFYDLRGRTTNIFAGSIDLYPPPGANQPPPQTVNFTQRDAVYIRHSGIYDLAPPLSLPTTGTHRLEINSDVDGLIPNTLTINSVNPRLSLQNLVHPLEGSFTNVTVGTTSLNLMRVNWNTLSLLDPVYAPATLQLAVNNAQDIELGFSPTGPFAASISTTASAFAGHTAVWVRFAPTMMTPPSQIGSISAKLIVNSLIASTASLTLPTAIPILPRVTVTPPALAFTANSIRLQIPTEATFRINFQNLSTTASLNVRFQHANSTYYTLQTSTGTVLVSTNTMETALPRSALTFTTPTSGYTFVKVVYTPNRPSTATVEVQATVQTASVVTTAATVAVTGRVNVYLDVDEDVIDFGDVPQGRTISKLVNIRLQGYTSSPNYAVQLAQNSTNFVLAYPNIIGNNPKERVIQPSLLIENISGTILNTYACAPLNLLGVTTNSVKLFHAISGLTRTVELRMNVIASNAVNECSVTTYTHRSPKRDPLRQMRTTGGLSFENLQTDGWPELWGDGDIPAQWYLCSTPNGSGVRAKEAWDAFGFQGRANLRIGIVEQNIPPRGNLDIDSKTIQIPPSTPTPLGPSNHTLAVAGIAAAGGNNALGLVGIDRFAKLSFDIEQNLLSSLMSNIDVFPQIRVVNCSYGGAEPTNHRRVFAELYRRNVVTVGSHNNNNKFIQNDFPAGSAVIPGIIAVGGIDRNARRADFSNYGPFTDIVAPAVTMMSTVVVQNFSDGFTDPSYLAPWLIHRGASNNPTIPQQRAVQTLGWLNSGCSFATPIVSGTASLMIGFHEKLIAEGSTNLPTILFNDDVKNLLKISAYKLPTYSFTHKPNNQNHIKEYDRNTFNQEVGCGRLDVYQALHAIKNGQLWHLNSSQADVRNGNPYVVENSEIRNVELYEVYTFDTQNGVPEKIPNQDNKNQLPQIRRLEVHCSVHFPVSIQSITQSGNFSIWGIGAASEMRGYNDVFAETNVNNQHFGIPWCTPLSVSATGATFRTFVYEIPSTTGTSTWFPCRPENVVVAFSVYAPPSDVTLPSAFSSTTLAVNGGKNTDQMNGEIWQRKQTALSVDAAADMVIAPNPYTDETTLRYSLQEASTVTIELFDALGKKVIDFAQSQKQNSGEYVVSLDLRRHSLLPTGVYHLKVFVNSASGATKIKSLPLLYLR